jgi:ABC-2 type transport system ATP-binding protein/lipopolysaccharide transport system ATP-binding protein
MDRVVVENVSKRYRLGRATTLRDAVMSFRPPALRNRAERERSSPDYLWSLKDVSFVVPEGGALGIVGHNGAGKSTMLKILTRITAPTEGSSRTLGRVAAMLEIGTGFHPELTGRENIYLNGSLLGMSRRDITARFSAIVEFAGLERFLDTPVKRYSSGMYLRLAFSVAAHLEPDILIVDEVLAVGDAEFRKRCLGQMSVAEREGRTVIFVSHDLDAVKALCPTSLWLDSGQVKRAGPSVDVVRHYLAQGQSTGRRDLEITSPQGELTLHAVEVVAARGGPSDTTLLRDEAVTVRLRFTVHQPYAGLDIAIFITSKSGSRVLDEALRDTPSGALDAGTYEVSMDVPPVLNVGEYTVGVWFGSAYDDLIHEPTSTVFRLHGSDDGRPDRLVVLGLPMAITPISIAPVGPA